MRRWCIPTSRGVQNRFRKPYREEAPDDRQHEAAHIRRVRGNVTRLPLECVVAPPEPDRGVRHPRVLAEVGTPPGRRRLRLPVLRRCVGIPHELGGRGARGGYRPYVHARRFTTLDHLTNGRLGWNIVTSDMQESLTRLLGETEVMAHDLRYDRAEEFVDLCLELWETAWDDDAMVFDKARRVAIEPSAVRRITHHGTYFDFDGYYPANPSPQRTPTLMQAGTSPRGLRFAADFAEAVFVQKRDIPSAKAVVARVRDAAEAAGRSRDSVKVVNSVSVIVGDTEAEARELRRSLSTAPSTAAMAALYMGWSGVDLMQYDPEDTLDGVRSEVGQSSALKYQSPDGKSPTVREILDGIVETTGGFKITGTPSQCAAELEKIARETDLDGYLIECTFGGTVSYDAFIDKVVPLLRENGIMPAEPRGGTLRERLIGTPTPALSALPRPVLHPSQSI
ncbi:MAG: N5,N10-methylene tetrahydromethanopterin reductase [Microbacterium sp.]|nr:MAG: N5,N10-methylene tetrahydromethanopterin reductase [Microbacterium sp.]